MKKFMLLALLMYGVACSNPEDHATGDPDSTSFNADEQKILNTPENGSDVEQPDASAAPALDKRNADSTAGTNRPYTPGGDKQ